MPLNVYIIDTVGWQARGRVRPVSTFHSKPAPPTIFRFQVLSRVGLNRRNTIENEMGKAFHLLKKKRAV